MGHRPVLWEVPSPGAVRDPPGSSSVETVSLAAVQRCDVSPGDRQQGPTCHLSPLPVGRLALQANLRQGYELAEVTPRQVLVNEPRESIQFAIASFPSRLPN